MTRKFLSFALCLALLLGLAPIARTQTTFGPKDFGFAFANDYAKYVLRSANDVASGAAVVTIQADGFATTPGGQLFYPLSTNAPVIIESENSAVIETVTPSAVTCGFNALSGTCTFSATFSNAHRAPFTIRSATFGVQEAINNIANYASGGTVVVANGFGGTTSTITTTVSGGGSTYNILDTRAGAFQFYAWGGSAYAASTSPLNSTTTPNIDVTTAVGAPYFYSGSATSAVNYGVASIANAASTNGAKFAGLKTRSASATGDANTIIVTGDDLLSIDAFGADGASYVNTAGILFDSTGTIASTRVPSVIKFMTGTDAAPTVKTLALTLDEAQRAVFAGSAVSSSFRNSTTALDATVTAQAPSPIVANVTAPATNANAVYVSGVASTVGAQVDLMKTRAVTAGGPATTTIVTGDDIAQLRAWGADGANYIEAARIEFDTTGTIASTRVPGVIRFSTGTDAAPTVLTTALTISADQSSTFAGQINASAAVNNTSAALALKTTTSGNITLTPAAAATAAVTVPSTRFETAKGATIDSAGASCTSGDCTLGGDGNFFIISNTTTVDGFATAGWQAGSIIVLQTSGSITFNNNGTVAGGFAAMKLVGGANVSMTADDNMILMYTGSFWDQIAPTLVK